MRNLFWTFLFLAGCSNEEELVISRRLNQLEDSVSRLEGRFEEQRRANIIIHPGSYSTRGGQIAVVTTINNGIFQVRGDIYAYDSLLVGRTWTIKGCYNSDCKLHVFDLMKEIPREGP